ncbi:MAG: phosphotransferase enzyme family protein, partial [Dehalococcoidia bacterium]
MSDSLSPQSSPARGEGADRGDMAVAVEEAGRLVSGWTGGAVQSVVRLSGGRANESYRVWLADGREVVFRWYQPRFSPGRSLDSIGYEHAVLRRLDALGLPVPVPLASRGETVGQAGGRFYAVLSYLAGEPFALGDAGLIEQAALVLVRIHDATPAVRDLGQRPGFGRSSDFDWVAPERPAVEWFTA